MTEVDGTLYRKIAEVVTEVERVDKDKRNDFHGYDYSSAEAILAALRGPLAAKGVALMPSIASIEERSYTTEGTRGPRESVITTVHISFTFVDGETGMMHRCDWAGQGDDPGDKGLAKAYTNALKTFLRDTFLLPQGDDPEADKDTDERASGRTGSRPRSGNSGAGGSASAAQKKLVRSLLTQYSFTNAQATNLLERYGVTVAEGEKARDAVDRLRWPAVSELIDELKRGSVQTGESDVPADPDLPWGEEKAVEAVQAAFDATEEGS